MAWMQLALFVVATLCWSVVGTPLDHAQQQARDKLQAALDNMATNHMATIASALDPDASEVVKQSASIRTRLPVLTALESERPSLGGRGQTDGDLGESLSLGESQSLGESVGDSDSAPAQPTAAQLEAAKPVAQQQVDNIRATLLKPPGCRPNELELSTYSKVRTLCATSMPPGQTPVTMAILYTKLLEINDERQTFTIEMARRFSWYDKNSSTSSLDKLWRADKFITFVGAIKTVSLEPPEVYAHDAEVMVKDVKRITFDSRLWDYSLFPFDTHNLRITMQTMELTDVLEPITVAVDSSTFTNDASAWKTSTGLTVTYSTSSHSLGPEGLWGKSQEIDISVRVERRWGMGIFRGCLLAALVPVFNAS